jgi:hypothetical protein
MYSADPDDPKFAQPANSSTGAMTMVLFVYTALPKVSPYGWISVVRNPFAIAAAIFLVRMLPIVLGGRNSVIFRNG